MATCDFIFQACFAIVTLPLLSFAVIMIFTWRKPQLSLAISLVCSTIPLILAWTLFFKLQGLSLAQPIIRQFNWLVSDTVVVPFGFLVDPVSLLMLVIVATISWLIRFS